MGENSEYHGPEVSHDIDVVTMHKPVGGNELLVSVPLHGGIRSADNPRVREFSSSERGMSEFLNEETLAQTIEEAFRNSRRYQNAVVNESYTHDPEEIAQIKARFEEKIKVFSKWFMDGVKDSGFDVENVMKVDANRFFDEMANSSYASGFFGAIFRGGENNEDWKEELLPDLEDFCTIGRGPSLVERKTTEKVYNFDAMRQKIGSQLPDADEKTLLEIYRLLGNE